MAFEFPTYYPPDFTQDKFRNAPDVRWAAAPMDGVAPEYYHSTSMYPEYFKINGEWKMIKESRMDSVIVIKNGEPVVTEPRRVKEGDEVVVGRCDDGTTGVFVNADCFVEESEEEEHNSTFAFRTGQSRETSFSREYDILYDIPDGIRIAERD